MKKYILGLLMTTTALASSDFYKLPLETKSDKGTFDKYKGKTLLIVNIATKCGFTGQLEDLEKLHQKYKDKNFEVIGVPSNDFGSQTPESDEGVEKFCKLNYGVSFPLLKKTTVESKQNALYKYLIENQSDKDEVGWNFVKFLVSKDGKVLKRFSSLTNPMSSDITELIDKNL